MVPKASTPKVSAVRLKNGISFLMANPSSQKVSAECTLTDSRFEDAQACDSIDKKQVGWFYSRKIFRFSTAALIPLDCQILTVNSSPAGWVVFSIQLRQQLRRLFSPKR